MVLVDNDSHTQLGDLGEDAYRGIGVTSFSMHQSCTLCPLRTST